MHRRCHFSYRFLILSARILIKILFLKLRATTVHCFILNFEKLGLALDRKSEFTPCGYLKRKKAQTNPRLNCAPTYWAAFSFRKVPALRREKWKYKIMTFSKEGARVHGRFRLVQKFSGINTVRDSILTFRPFFLFSSFFSFYLFISFFFCIFHNDGAYFITRTNPRTSTWRRKKWEWSSH